MTEKSQLKCANCGENHSAAAPICRKYQEVKNAWKIVATEGRSYADAIRLTSSNDAAMKLMGSRPADSAAAPPENRSSRSTCGRDDVIEATNSDRLSSIPTAVRRQWAVNKKPPATKTMATQTDEPVEQATQTPTSRDEGVQTVEVAEKAVHPYAEVETQTSAKSEDQQAEEQFFITTLLEIVGKLMEQADIATESKFWREATEKFNFVTAIMSERGYPVKMAPRRSTRQQDTMRGSSYRGRGGGARGSAVGLQY